MPDENIILIDGHLYKFQVDVAMTGQIESGAEWEMRAVFNSSSSAPFLLSAIGQGGLYYISSTITWEIPVHGKNENVQIDMYRVIHSKTGKTTHRTLVESIQREYAIICDRDELFFILKLKRLFKFCH